MSYISFRGVKVAEKNGRLAFLTSMLAIALWVAALVADHLGDWDLAFYSFVGARLAVMLALIIAVPAVVIPLGILLAPFAVAVYGLDHNHEVWTTWWFWSFSVLCAVIGGFALVWFGKKYSSRQ